MAESKGVEGTLKEGRGPVYRQIMGDLGKMQAAFKIQDDRVKDAKKRLDTAEARISQIKRELATIDGELAKYKGEEETAGQRIQHGAGRTSPVRTPSSASTPAACCRPSRRRAPSSASIPTRSASPRCSSAARSSTAPCSRPT